MFVSHTISTSTQMSSAVVDPDEDKYYKKAPRSSRPRSPSRRRMSSIEKKNDDDELTIDPSEIDQLITSWYEAKNQMKELTEKERRYKRMLNKILDLTGGDAIKGRDLQVTRRIQKRRFISKNLVPEDVFDRYAKTIEISALYIKEL